MRVGDGSLYVLHIMDGRMDGQTDERIDRRIGDALQYSYIHENGSLGWFYKYFDQICGHSPKCNE